MTIDFSDIKEYEKFAEVVKDWLIRDFQFQDELEDDIADSIVERHLQELSAAILDRLIEQKMQENKG